MQTFEGSVRFHAAFRRRALIPIGMLMLMVCVRSTCSMGVGRRRRNVRACSVAALRVASVRRRLTSLR